MGEVKKIDECPLCKREEADLLDSSPVPNQDARAYRINCAYCGEYRIVEDGLYGYPEFDFSQRLALSRVSKLHYKDRIENKSLKTILIKNVEDGELLIQNVIVPVNALEQLSSLLIEVANSAPNLGQKSPKYSKEDWTALAMLPSKGGFHSIVAMAKDRRLLDYNSLSSSDISELTLTIDGWEYLGTQKKLERKKIAFVAMWFHSELTEFWKNGFEPALKELGWNPVRIDKEHFTNRIDDEIMRRINESGVLIADITGARPGVYFEAGYAMGQDIPVIWTCNDSWETQVQKEILPHSMEKPVIEKRKWFELRHFDAHTFPFIRWKDSPDLKKQLQDKLGALKLTH